MVWSVAKPLPLDVDDDDGIPCAALTGGAEVTAMVAGGLAEASGHIHITDIITEINKKPAATMLDALAALRGDVTLTMTTPAVRVHLFLL